VPVQVLMLINVYTWDLPVTTSEMFIYADDIRLPYHETGLDKCEQVLDSDLRTLTEYSDRILIKQNSLFSTSNIMNSTNHWTSHFVDITSHKTQTPNTWTCCWTGLFLTRSTNPTLQQKTTLEISSYISSQVQNGKLVSQLWEHLLTHLCILP